MTGQAQRSGLRDEGLSAPTVLAVLPWLIAVLTRRRLFTLLDVFVAMSAGGNLISIPVVRRGTPKQRV